MRNQIVSQDELREEGGSPTHARFALATLLCPMCIMSLQWGCFLYVLWLGSRRSACSPRGTRPEIGCPADVRKLGRTATGETHSSYQNEVCMKWHSVCHCSAVYEMSRTSWPGASWTGKNCTAGLRMGLNPCDSRFHNFLKQVLSKFESVLSFSAFPFLFLYRFELKG